MLKKPFEKNDQKKITLKNPEISGDNSFLSPENKKILFSEREYNKG
jgi:hypothetical protein